MKNENLNKKVLVALSGGVDSSVAALLLKQQGFDVVGAYMKLYDSLDDTSLLSARSVAKKIGIEFHVFNLFTKFKKEVINYFVKTYQKGATPNPCVMCNKFIKFGWLLDKAKKMGCDYIATGHYTRLRREFSISNLQISNKFQITNTKFQVQLLKAKDTKKDQSYFLWQLDQKQLKCILFPIGDLTKNKVRQLARQYKLPAYNKSESQDVCFINDLSIKDFLKQCKGIANKKGKIIDIKGNLLGKHLGLAGYNIGQRLGNIDLNFDNFYHNINPQQRPPFYVLKLDVDKNELVVGLRSELDTKRITVEKPNWINPNIIKLPLKCSAKIRYQAQDVACTVKQVNTKIEVVFYKKVFAPASGQSIVFYNKNILLGGAIIS